MMHLKRNILVLTTVALGHILSLQGENWSNWRGPSHNGSTTEKNLPAKWSPTENIAWKTKLPGISAATPIIHGDHIFLPSTDEKTKELQAIALDRKTGKELWRKTVNFSIRRDNRSTYASSSAVTDGERAIFFYGNGDLVAYSFAGKELWQRNIQRDYGDFAFQWTFSSSPLLHNGTLYMQVLQRDTPVHGKGKEGAESYLLAIDPKTGKTMWRHVRASEAYAESLEAFSTPMPYTHEGREEILIVGGDCLTGHDPESGKEFWRWGTWNPTKIGHWRLVPSPAAGGGVVLACAPKRAPVYAVKLGGNGNLDDSALAWVSEDVREISSDVPTPLFYDGDFFVLSDVQNALVRVEPRTGKVKWNVELPRGAKYRSSPTAADGKIYFMNHDADVFVVDAASGGILNQIEMGDKGASVRASVVISQGNLFLRTSDALYCVGKKTPLAAK
jgi:outer membrane protein assembly factor BamB